VELSTKILAVLSSIIVQFTTKPKDGVPADFLEQIFQITIKQFKSFENDFEFRKKVVFFFLAIYSVDVKLVSKESLTLLQPYIVEMYRAINIMQDYETAYYVLHLLYFLNENDGIFKEPDTIEIVCTIFNEMKDIDVGDFIYGILTKFPDTLDSILNFIEIEAFIKPIKSSQPQFFLAMLNLLTFLIQNSDEFKAKFIRAGGKVALGQFKTGEKRDYIDRVTEALDSKKPKPKTPKAKKAPKPETSSTESTTSTAAAPIDATPTKSETDTSMDESGSTSSKKRKN